MEENFSNESQFADVRNFELATHIPVLIYTEGKTPALYYPVGKKFPSADLYHDVIKKCRAAKSTIFWAGPNGLIACCPVYDKTRNILGFLLIDRSLTDRSNDAIRAASMLLIWLGEHVSGSLLNGMEEQKYIDNFYHLIYNALSDTPDLTAETVIDKFLSGVGKTTAYQQFHTYVHMSVSKYINFVRLEKAKDMLSKTDLSVREISDQVGFNDYNYFCRVFKKETGMPANVFRRNSRTVL
jgi:AraC-like DNA-binding protein